MLVMLPMCIGFLLRTLAWVSLLEDTGIINNLLKTIGLKPLPLIRNAELWYWVWFTITSPI